VPTHHNKPLPKHGHPLTKNERHALPSHDFALPDTREYPIQDEYHAELALQDLKAANSRDQVKIRDAIRSRWPHLAEKRL
jgi:hypothetical protein